MEILKKRWSAPKDDIETKKSVMCQVKAGDPMRLSTTMAPLPCGKQVNPLEEGHRSRSLWIIIRSCI